MKLSRDILKRATAPAKPVAATGADFLEVEFPLHTVSEANRRDHWSVKAKRVRHQRDTVAVMLAGRALPDLPAEITLTRMGVGRLDTDNAASATKAVRDQVAAMYGVDDGDPRYVWKVEQEKCPTCKVRITIRPVGQGGGTHGA